MAMHDFILISMMDTLKKSILVFIISGIVFAAAVSACNSDRKGSVPENKTPERAVAAADSQHPDAVSGKLSVQLLPDEATSTTPLQAVCDYKGGAAITYRWERNNQIIAGEQGSILNPENRFSKGDRISVTVTVESKSVSSSVMIGNSPPAVASVSFKPEIIYRGIDITAVPVGSDPDGDNVLFNYRWSINGEDLSDNSAVLPGVRFKRGDRIILTITPYDSDNTGEPFITNPIIIPNAPPRFISTPLTSFKGGTYTYQSRAEDPDEDQLTYSLVSGPQGMNVDPQSGEVSMKIGKEHSGNHEIEIAAQDPQGMKADQKYTLNLTIP
jgi:hypothetical protein